MRKYIFFLVFCEACFIFFFLLKIKNQKRPDVRGVTIDNQALRKESQPIANFFYQLVPNTTVNDFPPWLKDKPIETHNSDGLNERFNYSIDKNKETYRIITLGNSFTYGIYVSTADNWVELLEDKLNNNPPCGNIKKYEVINLGVPGYDTQYTYMRYVSKGKKYNPDLIIWTHLDFDSSWERIKTKIDSYLKHFKSDVNYYNSERQKLLKEGQSSDNLYSMELVAMAKAILDDIKEAQGEKAVQFQNTFLDLFNRDYNKKLLYTYIGDRSGDKYVKEILLPRVDNRRTFFYEPQFLQDKGLRFSDGHFNKIGNKKMADELYDYLLFKNIIKCL